MKHLLKRAFRDLLPTTVLDRTKVGLNPPMNVWLKGELGGLVKDYLDPATVRRRGYFCPDAITGMLRGHGEGRQDFSLHIWALVMLEAWHREYTG